MDVTLNGQLREFPAESLTVSELIDSLDLGRHPVLVELNGETVLTREFRETSISDGDVLEIIRMVAGG